MERRLPSGLPDFDLLRPATLREALEMLAGAQSRPAGSREIVPIAGGTNIIPDLRAGGRFPNALLDLGRLDELRGIRQDDGYIVVGGGVTIAGLLRSALIARHAPALRDAAAVFANPLIRNRATIGGNLVDASPAADTAPPLLVLGAEVELASAAGVRRMPLEDFLLGVRETARRSDELVTALRWRIPEARSASRFHKVGLRKADAVAVLSVSVALTCAPPGDFCGNGSGRCAGARIALGAVAPRPLRATAAEEMLRDQSLTPAVITEAARCAAEEAARPISDIRGSAAYRRQVTEVIVRRLLTQVTEELADAESGEEQAGLPCPTGQ